MFRKIVLSSFIFFLFISSCEDQCEKCSTVEICNNREDDDGDGLIDCADGDCEFDSYCRWASKEICDDSLDNDLDSFVDCWDEDCQNDPACINWDIEICDDGKDNDLDGAVDCDDLSCRNTQYCLDYMSEESSISVKVNNSHFVFATVCKAENCNCESVTTDLMEGEILMFNIYSDDDQKCTYPSELSACIAEEIYCPNEVLDNIEISVKKAEDDNNAYYPQLYLFCGPIWAENHAIISFAVLLDKNDMQAQSCLARISNNHGQIIELDHDYNY